MSVMATKIGEMLLKGNLITTDQLRSALEAQKRSKERIGIVAVADPSNIGILDAIGFKTGYGVELVLASEKDITSAINKFFDRSLEFKDIISELDEELEVVRGAEG